MRLLRVQVAIIADRGLLLHTFARVIQPAVVLTEDGFDVDPELADSLQYRKSVLSRLPETRRVFTKPAGTFYARGDRFRQPELAHKLRQAATQGVGYMYTGDWARRIVDAVRRGGGLTTLRDFSPKARATEESALWVWEEMQTGKWPYAMKPPNERPGHSVALSPHG